ncbi:MAG: GDP-L-fucose synthase [Candidatus Omnitrophota bacterium]|nr:MAG: GDP-L-fucose synthase [Candidatus Omnitrophota bacterium]
MKKNSRIFIAAHHSLIGQALLHRLKREGFTNLITRSRSQLDLTREQAVRSFFNKERPEYCFLTSIKEGGIGANISYPAELIYENLSAQTNVIHSARRFKVKKLMFFASSCVYPKQCPQPMKEEYLLTGLFEPTNVPYATAKAAGIKMCQAYNSQYDTRFISVIPATVFGPGDNFDLNNSHVIPALMHKFHQAKLKKSADVVIWGSGTALREFIYIDEVIEACLFLMRSDNCRDLINVGTGEDISIKELAELIKKVVGFKGKLKFDTKKPDGVLRKLLDVSILSSLGWKAKLNLESGLKDTYRWYEKKSIS